ncbi:MAG: dual specificity protein phosphatase family protein [Planctomycetes bacterium]|nr:dual specificity protein phosphatase family protein [Planctomycetota bacterium]NUQ33776.1 dual specificity protein phosphatase family protein [Planctomycetaceae bacterium]
MRDFSWIKKGQLAGMAMPGSATDIEDDLQFLRDSGIRLLVSLSERPIDPQLLARYDISALHLPVADFTPPSIEQLRKFLDHVRFTLSQGGAVGVHCRAGLGRTGTVLASYLISEGMDTASAMAEVRRIRPGSIETDEQEAVLEEFERALRKKK